MRFLMLNWRDPHNPMSGGAERVSQAYLAALVARGHQVYWFANDFEGAAPEEVIDGIAIVRGGGKGSSVLKAIQWYRHQPRFDLVIDQHHGIPWFAPWWSKTNCVAYIHEVLGPIWNVFYRWPLSTLGRWQERWTHSLYRRVHFWVPSESTSQALRRHGVRQVTVIPNGTDTPSLPELEVKQLTQPLQLIAVSRLAPNKRVEHAIELLGILVARNTPALLTVVGTGESESGLKKLVKQLHLESHVTFTGKLSEPAKNDQLRKAHFLVHTSVREGWGLNVIEANALGTPAIVYPVPGLVDSTVHDSTGIVTADETPASLANDLLKTLSAPGKYDRLRLNAWERSKSFQWDHVLPLASDWLEKQAAPKS